MTILHLGCGPGRDHKVCAGLGHIAVGLDGAACFVAMARADTRCDVWQQCFLFRTALRVGMEDPASKEKAARKRGKDDETSLHLKDPLVELERGR